MIEICATFSAIKLRLAGIGLFIAASSAPFAAEAVTFQVGGPEVINPDRLLDFGNGAPFQPVTNQFSDSGLTVTTLSGAGLTLTNNLNCNNAGSGVSQAYIYMGVINDSTGFCVSSSSSDAASLSFDTKVSELSWTGFNVAEFDGFLLEARLDGSVVGSIIFNVSNQFLNKTVRIFGGMFDELRFIEQGSSNLFFAADNFKWNTASAVVPVPFGAPMVAAAFAMAGLLRWHARKSAPKR
ncbi:MAG: hypothetical protein AAF676_09555 [Pseudomonadota bacterium]